MTENPFLSAIAKIDGCNTTPGSFSKTPTRASGVQSPHARQHDDGARPQTQATLARAPIPT